MPAHFDEGGTKLIERFPPPSDLDPDDAATRLYRTYRHTEARECIDLSNCRPNCVLVQIAEGCQLIRRYADKFSEFLERELFLEFVPQSRPSCDCLIKC